MKKTVPIKSGASFGELTRAECDALLAQNHVGRIAFTFHDRVDVEPVHYVYADGLLHGRTAPGTKLATLLHHPWVAFEVDEAKGLFDWRSVVVHGTVDLPQADGSSSDREAHAATLEQIRTLVPDALEKNDPTPWRFVLFRIHVAEMTGRYASTRKTQKKTQPSARRPVGPDRAPPNGT